VAGQSEVAEVLAEVADLQARLQKAYEAGDAAAADRLISELATAERRRNRVMQRALATTRGYRATLPVREQVIRVLALVERPAAVSLIRDLASARFGDRIEGPRLASLRRDEHRSWRSAHDAASPRAGGRPVYVVPALTYDRLAPVRGLLALSSWPLELRLIAPASQRVDLLHIADKLARELAAAPDAPWASEVESVLWRLAATVPGATGRGELDPQQVREAVAFELAQLQEADAAERAEAAARAREQLDEEHQLFGSRLAAVPGGRTAARTRP
jgi:hypothetical protein